MDYEKLRSFVLQVIAEHEEKLLLIQNREEPQHETEVEKESDKDGEAQMEFDEAAIQDILLSVEAFRG